VIEVNFGGIFIPKRHRPTLFALTKLKWKTNTKRHSQADDLWARFKVPEWGVFCHTARLRNPIIYASLTRLGQRNPAAHACLKLLENLGNTSGAIAYTGS